MASTTISQAPLISQRLNATKKLLQDATIDERYVWSGEMRRVGLRFEPAGPRLTWKRLRSGKRTNRTRGLRLTCVSFQFDIPERDPFKTPHLRKNRLAPINRVPPEILALIPDFRGKHCDRDQFIITLTHVCRDWREVFISRSSLWTDLDCKNEDKTRIYFERSKPLPVNLSLYTDDPLPPHHPFFKIIPHAIGRLRSLIIDGTLESLPDITAQLFRPAPLLEELSICSDYNFGPRYNPTLTPTLFNGDLSSLRTLELKSVRTELPWRNLGNLTSIKLVRISPGEITVKQLLDFFESTPRLRQVGLRSVTPTSGTQNGRMVSLAYLETMDITGDGSASLLLDHLLIPVGAYLKIEIDLPIPPIKDPPPRFLDNLRNLSDFTEIKFYGASWNQFMLFRGPNGEVIIIPGPSQVNRIYVMFGFLTQFQTSSVERLMIYGGRSPTGDLPYRALLPMMHLHTLTLHGFASPDTFIHALDPNMNSTGAMVCPQLEELNLVLSISMEIFDIKNLKEMAVARASKGAKLKSVKIAGRKLAGSSVVELKKHVLRVKCDVEVD
jgi:hypothetical protein